MEIVINPRKHQRQLLENPSRKLVVVAHRRFGKTTLALFKILLSAQNPQTRYFYLSPTYRQSKMVAWEMLVNMIPKQLIAKKNEVELIVGLTNGSTIELKGADNPDSLRGVGLDGVVLDEFAQINPSMWSEIIRPALTDRKGWALFIGTPKGKNHFFDLYMNTPETDRCLLKASQTGILDAEELESARKEMNRDEFNQEFECDFLYFSGQIYKEFKPEKHVLKNYDIMRNWDQGVAIDHGQVNPTAALFYAVDYDDRIIIFDEYYQAGNTVSTNVKNINELIAKNDYKVNGAILDPSAFAKNRSKDNVLYSVADEYADANLVCIPGQNDVLAGINRVKEYFQNDRLFILARCENTIKELESYRWKDKRLVDSNLPEEPLKVNDHAVDALRYIINSRPAPSKRPLPENYEMQLRREKFMRVGSHRDTGWYD